MESTTYIYIFLFIYIFICILCISFYIYVSGLRSFLWVNALYHRIVFITQFTESFWNRGTAEVHHDDSFFLHTHFFFHFFSFVVLAIEGKDVHLSTCTYYYILLSWSIVLAAQKDEGLVAKMYFSSRLIVSRGKEHT